MEHLKTQVLKVVLVEDETLARQRLVGLIKQLGHEVLADFSNAGDTLEWFKDHTAQADVILLDIHLGNESGITLAKTLLNMPTPPMIIFVSAHEQHALEAFDVAAVHFITKPVHLLRLKDACDRVLMRLNVISKYNPNSYDGAFERMFDEMPTVTVKSRDKIRLVSLGEARYFKAEHKYVTLYTKNKEYVLDESLVQLEKQFGEQLVRIHRNCLVVKHAVIGMYKHYSPREEDSLWVIKLKDVDALLPISRRKLSAVRHIVSHPNK